MSFHAPLHLQAQKSNHQTADLEEASSNKNSSCEGLDSTLRGSEPFQLPAKCSKPNRAAHYPFFSTHRRLMVLVAILNFIVLIVGILQSWWENLPALGHATISNLTLSILVRNQYFINCLYRVVLCCGTTLPLSVRWMLAKVYHFGGLHSGCAVSGTLWLLLFTISATQARVSGIQEAPSFALILLTYVIVLMLICMVVLALPPLRSRFHDSFEMSHRFLGWIVLGFVWIHTILLISDFKLDETALPRAVFSSVSPYLLLAITSSIIAPWMQLRKVPVRISKPSGHAIVVNIAESSAFPGSVSTISLDPVTEWHSFANIPTPGKCGFRLIISRAGDWTSNTIDNPPSHFWMKGISTAGMATVAGLFKKVLFVATGSGIGPVLPHLLAKEVPSKLFWSARTPEETYGEKLVEEILESSPDAVIHDTTFFGKPDMVATTYRMWEESRAEAVIIISNQKLTRKVVYGVEARGVPAFGAIWDS